MRKPVSSHLGPDRRTMVVCNDGSTWRWDSRREAWEESDPIPGTMRTGEFVRTPVSSHVAAASHAAADKRHMVLCDDGSAWKWDAAEREWYKFTAPIPGTVDDRKDVP